MRSLWLRRLLCGLSAIAAVSTVATGQESVTFTNLDYDGAFGSTLNPVLSHVFQYDFSWGGEIEVTWTVRPAAGQPGVPGRPMWDIQTQYNGVANWGLGLQSLPGFTGYPFFSSERTGTRRFSPRGYSNFPTGIQGQSFDFRFFSEIDSLPGTPNGNWESITFTFLPYTPPAPPVNNSSVTPRIIVLDAGSITTPNGYVDITLPRVRFQDPGIMGLYNMQGLLLERFANSQFNDRTFRRELAPGTYYIAYGDDTTEFQNRFLFQDYQGAANSGGAVRISNGAGTTLLTGGSSVNPDDRQEWSTFTIIPAPGAATALLLLSGTLAGTRRRR